MPTQHARNTVNLFPAHNAMFRLSKCLIITIKSSHLKFVYF